MPEFESDEPMPESEAAETTESTPALPSISRRRFATVLGAGGLLVAGGAMAAPRISTIRFGAKAAVGTPHGGSTTTTISGEGSTTTIPGGKGKISLSPNHAPCVGGVVTVTATGFVPKTSVTIEIDSPAHTLAVTTADNAGNVKVNVTMPNSPTGPHSLLAVGLAPGGQTMTLSAPVNIKTQGECKTSNEGETTETTAAVDATGSASSGASGHGDSSLPFTGTDSAELALLGVAAAVAGRVIYGFAKKRRDEIEETEPGTDA
jgi:hypothetical protein